MDFIHPKKRVDFFFHWVMVPFKGVKPLSIWFEGSTEDPPLATKGLIAQDSRFLGKKYGPIWTLSAVWGHPSVSQPFQSCCGKPAALMEVLTLGETSNTAVSLPEYGKCQSIPRKGHTLVEVSTGNFWNGCIPHFRSGSPSYYASRSLLPATLDNFPNTTFCGWLRITGINHKRDSRRLDDLVST